MTDLEPHRRHYRLGTIITALLLYILLLGSALPLLLQWQLPLHVSALLERTTTLEQVRFDPFRWRLQLSGLRIAASDEQTHDLYWRNVSINLAPVPSLWQRQWVFDEVLLDGVELRLSRSSQGLLNVQDLLTRFGGGRDQEVTPTQDPSPLPRWRLEQLVIRDLQLLLEDHASRSFVQRLQLEMLEIAPLESTLLQESQVALQLRAPSGGRLTVDGNANRQALTLQVVIDQWALPPWLDYLAPQPLRLLAGTLSSRATVNWQGDDRWSITPWQLQLDQPVVGQAQQPWWQTRQLRVEQAELDLAARQVQLGRIALLDGELWIERDEAGLNWQQALSSSATQTTVPEPEETSAVVLPWRWQVGLFEIDALQVHWLDRVLDWQTQGRLDTQLQALSSDATPAALAWQWQSVLGQANWQGTLLPAPWQLKGQLQLQQWNLAEFPPLPDPLPRVALSGWFSSVLQMEASANQVVVSGDLQLEQMALSQQGLSQPLLRWQKLQLQGLSLDTQARQLTLQHWILEAPEAWLQRDTDGVLNWQALLAGQTAATGESESVAVPTADSTSAAWWIQPGTGQLLAGHLHWQDDTLAEPLYFDLRELQLMVEVDSEQRTQLAAQARLPAKGNLALQGALQMLPGGAAGSVELDLKGLELPLLSGYAERYLGYAMARGDASLGLDYHLEGPRFRAEHQLLVRHLQLGDAREPADLPALPLPLAIALLQDIDGNLRLNLPLSGSLSDPDFHYRSLLLRGLRNSITNVALTPFTLLANLAGRSAEELSRVSMPVGQATLDDHAQQTLKDLASALQQRPRLQLLLTPRLTAADQLWYWQQQQRSWLAALPTEAAARAMAWQQGAAQAGITLSGDDEGLWQRQWARQVAVRSGWGGQLASARNELLVQYLEAQGLPSQRISLAGLAVDEVHTPIGNTEQITLPLSVSN